MDDSPMFANPWATLISDSLDEVIEKNEKRWNMLKSMLECGDFTVAEYSAALFPTEVRIEAARKIIGNHLAVLKDVTNMAPNSQRDLERVPRADGKYVDMMLLEVARRLLGRRPNVHDAAVMDKFLEMKLDTSNEQMTDAWLKTALYLGKRIQSTPEQKKGRNPDMSLEASQAFLMVCYEVGESDPKWVALRNMINGGDPSVPTKTDGVANTHPRAAREEAAKKLVNNHYRVMMDITNQAPLTQAELQRIPPQYRPLVDAFLREMCRRLHGHRAGPESFSLFRFLEEKLEEGNPDMAAVWGASSQYLTGRIQSVHDQKPGREPDMSLAAATAFVQVAHEIGSGKLMPIEEPPASWNLTSTAVVNGSSGKKGDCVIS